MSDKKSGDLSGAWKLYSSVPPDPDIEEEEDDFDIIYFRENQRQTELKKIKEFSNYDEFWEAYNKAPRPSTLWGRGALYFVKKGVMPTQSDPAHSGGTSYTKKYSVLCKDDPGSIKVENKFLHIVLSILSKNSIKGDPVTAVIFESTKTETMITVWCQPMDNDEAEQTEKHLRTIFGKGTVFVKNKIKQNDA